MKLERRAAVLRPAFDCVVACACETPCDGLYGRCAEKWEWSIRAPDLAAGVSIEVITDHDHPATPASIRKESRSWSFVMHDHHAFPIRRLELIDGAPGFPKCWATGDRECWNVDGYYCTDPWRKSILALVDETRGVDEQPEAFWEAFEAYAESQIDMLITRHQANVAPYEKCPCCDGKGIRKKP